METSLTPVKNWTVVDLHAAIAQVKGDARFAVKSHRLHAGEVSPVTLYCYLKTRFGPPNGMMMAFRAKSSANVVQWHYTLAVRAHNLDIWGTNAGLKFTAHGAAPIPDDEWDKVFQQLKAEFSAVGPQMAPVRAALEKWSLFVNPFRRLEHVVKTFEYELEQIDVSPPEWPPEKSRVQEYLQALGTYSERSIRARTAGFCLRLMAPIYAESFVNFVLYFCCNDTLTRSDDEYCEVVRLPIHERVLGLPSRCRGFASLLREDATEYRDFLRLMNGRNDLVHGNCDPTQLRVGSVLFDDTIPLWQQDGSTIARLLEQSMRHVAKVDALHDVEIVRSFIKWVLAAMTPDSAKALGRLMVSEYPGLRPDTGYASILLPNNIYESYLGS